MRYLIITILVFIINNCFAIDQDLIEDMKKYKAAKQYLDKIEHGISKEKRSIEFWSDKLDKGEKGFLNSSKTRKHYYSEINKSGRRIQNLNIKYADAKKALKELEPIKREYDKQLEIERKRERTKTAILNISGMLGLPLAFFILWLFFARWILKRNKRLLAEGKITKEDLEQMMKDGKSSISDEGGINPSTGLPLTGIGISDAGGNVRGSSSDRYYRDSYR